MSPTDVTIRPMNGADELDLFCQLPYVLLGELAEDLDSAPQLPDIFDLADIDDPVERAERVEVGVELLRTAASERSPWR